jgi:hypothetical protein
MKQGKHIINIKDENWHFDDPMEFQKIFRQVLALRKKYSKAPVLREDADDDADAEEDSASA